MSLLERDLENWHEAGFEAKIVDAPKDAITFDKMLVVFNGSGRIRQVSFWSTKERRYLSHF